MGLFPRPQPEEVEARPVEVRWRDAQERPVEVWGMYQLFALICLRFDLPLAGDVCGNWYGSRGALIICDVFWCKNKMDELDTVIQNLMEDDFDILDLLNLVIWTTKKMIRKIWP